ncbi:DUF932 domain-containing protein [Natrinema marinum]|uniref:DUF932 domain-containing protein n=1 Tax=Natrinema marinum TaxID=2961598 RepID=UPI0020C931DC|nr:DUF932 domain-containing protein [Natrinema marinum]
MQEQTYAFDDLDQLYETTDKLPQVERHEVYAHHEGEDVWEEIPYRDSLWTDDLRATGVVSSSKDFYNIIQYGDILETICDAIDRHQDSYDLGVTGTISLSPTAHKMSAKIGFTGDTTVYAADDDPIELGLQIQSGHSGFHAVKYDVGGMRQVCSNGMMAFDGRLHFEQTHSEPFQPSLAYNAVDSVVESPEIVENRIKEAQNQTFLNQDEALLVLLEQGLGEYLEQPVPDLLNSLHDEINDKDSPTLWETYNAATRALTHYSKDVPDYELDTGFEKAATLLENGYSKLPNANKLGKETVEDRADQFIEEQDETETYWNGEEESLRELMAEHQTRA